MAIRTDIFSIDWSVSPRVIWIDIAFDEVSAQDLYDTCKHLEALYNGVDEGVIADAGGWEPLGVGKYVGITVSLFNAVYAFEDRPGPAWVICNMTGGNVVAFTDESKQTTLYPRKPTAYISADRTASSSATTQELDAIQYDSYSGGVTIDVTSQWSGTENPVGTPRQPVNNIDDAYAIAVDKGLPHVFYVIGDLHLTSATPDLDGFTFIGSGMDRSHIEIDANANVNDCAYFDAHILGTLDGDSRLQGCVIDNLNYIKGYIEQCVLSPGTIVLGGGATAHFLDCYSGVPGTGTPTIDMGGSGQALALRNYNGGIKLINKSGSDSVSIDMNSGQVKLGNDVTGGDIVLRGVGTLTEDLSAGANVINQLLNTPAIADGVWEKTLP